MEKRYAIVRVDNTWCPNKFEDIDNRFVCDSRRKNIKYVHCERCNYGDTKEQLVRKIVSYMNRLYVEQYQNNMAYTYEKIAKKIVEFLGVKE